MEGDPDMAMKSRYILRDVAILMSLFLLSTSSSITQIKNASNEAGQSLSHTTREKLLLDPGWKFHLGDASDPANDFDYGIQATFAKAGETAGAIHPDFNDSSWRTLDLPHDWAVELDFVNVKDEDVKSHGYKPIGRQFSKSTIGWYRRAFFVPKEDEGRRLEVKFDGVFRDCIVWLNGHYLGNNLSGYSEFGYDITDYLRYGQKNVLVVRVDVSQYEGWFYEGAGIYRHTWLIKTDPLHIPEYGVFVHTTVGKNAAHVYAETDVVDKSESGASCTLTSLVVDEHGAIVASSSKATAVLANERKTVRDELTVNDPLIWSIEKPHLYTLVSVVTSNGATVDSVRSTFGIRTVRFDKDKGLFLNDKRVEIKGVCNHQDHAGVGSALPDRLQYLPDRATEGDGMQRVQNESQSADERVARSMRQAWHAGFGRKPFDGKYAGTHRSI